MVVGWQGRGCWGGWMDPGGAARPRQRPQGPQALTCSHPQDSSSRVSMPSYFRFLTLMAFHVFLQEKVHAHSPEPCVQGRGDTQAGGSHVASGCPCTSRHAL